MSPYTVTFSDQGTSCALLDICFETNQVTSQEVEQVLRAEIEKHKDRTKRPIRAEAFLEGVDYEIHPFGLRLPDGSHSITYYHKADKAMTAIEAGGGHDNLTGETDSYFYSTDTVQTIGPEGHNEWIEVRMVLKSKVAPQPYEFFTMLTKVLIELSDLEKDLAFTVVAGEPRNPLSWRQVIGHDGQPLRIQYDTRTGTVRERDSILFRLPEVIADLAGLTAKKKSPAKRKKRKKE